MTNNEKKKILDTGLYFFSIRDEMVSFFPFDLIKEKKRKKEKKLRRDVSTSSPRWLLVPLVSSFRCCFRCSTVGTTGEEGKGEVVDRSETSLSAFVP